MSGQGFQADILASGDAQRVGTSDDVLTERIPLVAETLSIDKQVVDTGRVRIQTFVDSEQVVLREALTRGVVEVERVAIGREVATAPAIREEGNVLVIPVVEERLVVEKRLVLVEELRVHRSTITVPVEVPTTRRTMRAVVERDDDLSANLSTPQQEAR